MIDQLNIVECRVIARYIEGHQQVHGEGVSENKIRAVIKELEGQYPSNKRILEALQGREISLQAARDRAYAEIAAGNLLDAKAQFNTYFKLLGKAKDPHSASQYKKISHALSKEKRWRRSRVWILVLLVIVVALSLCGREFAGAYSHYKSAEENIEAERAKEAEEHLGRYAFRWHWVQRTLEWRMGFDPERLQLEINRIQDCQELVSTFRDQLTLGEDLNAEELLREIESTCSGLGQEELLDQVGRIHVKTEPGAEVRLFGASDLEIRNIVMPESGQMSFLVSEEGVYRIRIDKEPYKRIDQAVIIKRGEDKAIEPSLALKDGEVTILAHSEDEIWARNKLLGKGYSSIPELKPGTHEFIIRRPGYHDKVVKVEVLPGEGATVDVPEMEPVIGSIMINAFYRNEEDKVREVNNSGRIKVNGESWQDISYPAQLSLPVGQHFAMVELDGYQSVSSRYPIVVGTEMAVFDIEFVPDPALIRIEPNVQEYRLILDGAKVDYKDTGIKVRPFVDHHFEVIAEGYERQTIKIDALGPGEVLAPIKVTLSKIPEFQIDVRAYYHRGRQFMQMEISASEENSLDAMGRDFFILVDTSKSMPKNVRGEIASALLQSEKFSADDRVEVITFGDATLPCFGGLVAATPSNISVAASFIESSRRGSETDLLSAMDYIVNIRNVDLSNQAAEMIVISDGQVNAGEKDFQDILRKVAKSNRKGISISGIILNEDPNESLFDLLSYKTGGITRYIEDSKNLREELLSIVRSLSPSILTDVTIEIEGLEEDHLVAPQSVVPFRLGQTVELYAVASESPRELSISIEGFSNGKKYSEGVTVASNRIGDGESAIAARWAKNYLYELYWDYLEASDKQRDRIRDHLNSKSLELAKFIDVRQHMKNVYPFRAIDIDYSQPIPSR